MKKDFKSNRENNDSVNSRNQQEFEKIMDNATIRKSGFYSKNNILVRLITFLLWTFAILGCLYYFMLWLSTK